MVGPPLRWGNLANHAVHVHRTGRIDYNVHGTELCDRLVKHGFDVIIFGDVSGYYEILAF